ncbi:DUF871 domain-containing protein [Salsuginibacillus kocurii]|uniref:DUF871 domain-containing protein n=1 Tax=Salsuginibacillus kocurii TaxID=427078 RepID=UPI0003807DA7|nr:MupG family TIM beta-alpha barrel fold protein [Salsuginibacillus kocurii]
MRGISIYLNQQSSEEQWAYLSQMKAYGFSAILTSLHLPEDDPTFYVEALKTLGSQAKQLDMELIADVSPSSLEHLGLTFESAPNLLDWGVDGIRADYGIEPESIASLSHKMRIALNASTITDSFLQTLIELGLETAHTEAWHNFYPRPETGLAKAELQEQNAKLQAAGIRTLAFVAGDGKRRGPLHQGLPTLEKHRNVAPFSAALELWRDAGVDKVMIGDPDLSDGSAEAFQAFDEGVVTLDAVWEKPGEAVMAIARQPHRQRLDPARDVVRSETSRFYASQANVHISADREASKSRLPGAITIDNELYGRYQGELQVAKVHLPADEKVNVVGYIAEEDLPLIHMLRPGEHFQFRDM